MDAVLVETVMSRGHQPVLPAEVLTLLAPPGANITAQGCAIDFQRAIYFNRTLVNSGLPGCDDGTVIEQRVYAHRALRELFVFELRAFSAAAATTSLRVAATLRASTLPAIARFSPSSPRASAML